MCENKRVLHKKMRNLLVKIRIKFELIRSAKMSKSWQFALIRSRLHKKVKQFGLINSAPPKNVKTCITRLAKYKLSKINRCHSISLTFIRFHFHKKGKLD